MRLVWLLSMGARRGVGGAQPVGRALPLQNHSSLPPSRGLPPCFGESFIEKIMVRPKPARRAMCVWYSMGREMLYCLWSTRLRRAQHNKPGHLPGRGCGEIFYESASQRGAVQVQHIVDTTLNMISLHVGDTTVTTMRCIRVQQSLSRADHEERTRSRNTMIFELAKNLKTRNIFFEHR